MNGSRYWRKRIINVFTVAIVFCGVWISALQAQTTAPNPLQGLREFLAPAISVHQRHSQALMADRNVVGTAVGLTANGQPAIKVFTRSESIMRIPTNLEGLPVEIEMTGPIHALAAREKEAAPEVARVPTNPRKEFPLPVPIGVSVGNQNDVTVIGKSIRCSAGTLSARVIDSGGNVYALGNNHVFAMENNAPANSNIVQPGPADTRCGVRPSNVIGTLTSFVSIDFSTSADNTVDAAIAISDRDHLGNATPKGGYGTPQSATVPVSSDLLGQKVQKYGETTRLTRGKVMGIDATVLVEYDSGTAQFVDQIVIRSSLRFIGAGDSGSLLVTNPDANPVGLLFAGNKSGRMAIANPIDLVLSAFGVSIDGQ
jgi:hypothetical protein